MYMSSNVTQADSDAQTIGPLCVVQTQKKNVVALKKASTSIQSIIKMIEGGASCYQVLQQTRAVMGLLKGVQNRSVQCSIEEEFISKEPVTEQDKIAKIQQIVKSVELFNK